MHSNRTSAVALCALILGPAVASASIFSTDPIEDTFARAAVPNGTYGSGGGLNVSGATATNGDGDAQGLIDSWLKFNLSGAVAQFDGEFGVGQWTIQSATLRLREIAAPNSPVFNRGVGQFDIRWIDDDNWSEAPGNPATPGIAIGNQIGYTYGLSILDAGVDELLGTHTNAGIDSTQSFGLAPAPGMTADVTAGGMLTLYLTAHDGDVGFTFSSSATGNASNRPTLMIEAVAVPEPATAALLGIGVVAGVVTRRRRV